MGDYDKRVVILTKERGKISAFARGARRPNSSLVGVTTPFAFGEMTLYDGEAPEVFACVSCGSTEELEVFSESGQGMLCSECCHEVKDGKRLHPSTVYAMQYIISSSIEKLYTFTVSAQVQKELKQLMKQYIRHHIDKNFKSLEVLEVCIR